MLGHRVRVLPIPTPVRNALLGAAGRFSSLAADLDAMLRFSATGRYVADTSRQAQLLGPVPTAEEAIRRWVQS